MSNQSFKLSKAGFTLFILSLILVFTSCGPTVYYLGNNHEKTTEIAVFYNEKDIGKEYRTIGQMTHDLNVLYDPDMIKDAMIEKAKEIGGDGILFKNTQIVNENGSGDQISIMADVIKFTESKDRTP